MTCYHHNLHGLHEGTVCGLCESIMHKFEMSVQRRRVSEHSLTLRAFHRTPVPLLMLLHMMAGGEFLPAMATSKRHLIHMILSLVITQPYTVLKYFWAMRAFKSSLLRKIVSHRIIEGRVRRVSERRDA